jgi:hypothetical protein
MKSEDAHRDSGSCIRKASTADARGSIRSGKPEVKPVERSDRRDDAIDRKLDLGSIVEVTPGVQCRVEWVGEKSVLLSALPGRVAGGPLSFRPPFRDELRWIHHGEKLKREKERTDLGLRTVSKLEAESQTDRFEFIRQLQREAQLNQETEKEVGKTRSSLRSVDSMTDELRPPQFRTGDMILLKSGPKAIITATISDNLFEVYNDSNVEGSVHPSEIVTIFPGQAAIFDGSGRKICLGDVVVHLDSEYKVLAMCNNKLFLRGSSGMLCCQAKDVSLTLPESGHGRASVLGKTVRKIYRIGKESYSEPFVVRGVSRKGFLKAVHEGATGFTKSEKFKFVDHKKLWLFSDEIRGEWA